MLKLTHSQTEQDNAVDDQHKPVGSPKKPEYVYIRNPYWTVAPLLRPESMGKPNSQAFSFFEKRPRRRDNRRSILRSIEPRLDLDSPHCNGQWVRWRSVAGRVETLLKHCDLAYESTLMVTFEKFRETLCELLRLPNTRRGSSATVPRLTLGEAFVVLRKRVEVILSTLSSGTCPAPYRYQENMKRALQAKRDEWIEERKQMRAQRQARFQHICRIDDE